MNVQAPGIEAETLKPRSAAIAWGDALAATAAIEKYPSQLLPHIIERLACDHGDAPALLSDTENFSFANLNERMNQYANWAISQGMKSGDCVALMLTNRPDYVAIWLGLSKLGIVTALINTSLTGNSLLHCLRIAKPRHIIAEQQFVPTCGVCSNELKDARVWNYVDILRQQSIEAIVPVVGEPVVTIDDIALLIYTSGTTGLPKAARISHRRILSWSLWFKGLLGNTPSDRMYDCLPLYHSVGGIVAVMATLTAGGSTVITGKFSASRFWDDVRRWDCTQIQYIGELCRYLLNSPPGDTDGCGRLRLACGNGLRGDIWKPFQDRFSIPRIVEFYAATEGNFSLFNVEGKPGSIGRIPPYLRHRFPTAIVKYGAPGGQPARGPDGFCIAVDPGEAGEALGRIGRGDGPGRFEGYTDESESERKILRNVFAAGDAWFRTGDLMRFDAAGFFYFMDRIGDTFRWKGENVSTLEVANVLSGAPGVIDAVAYGVEVPGMDGRAGMALVMADDRFDLRTFRKHAETQLPHYAIPVFLRIASEVAVTETFKHKKTELMADGFDPVGTAGCLYVWRNETVRYEIIDAAIFEKIKAGLIRL